MTAKKKSGYTLVELIIVMGIIALAFVFGLPAFSKYGRLSDSNQKSEEVRAMIANTQTLALNPENSTVKVYRLDFDKTVANQNKYIIRSCDTNPCTATADVRVVTLLKAETIQFSSTDSSTWLVSCPTSISDGRVSCLINPNISGLTPSADGSYLLSLFRDDDSSVLRSYLVSLYLNPYRLGSISTQLN